MTPVGSQPQSLTASKKPLGGMGGGGGGGGGEGGGGGGGARVSVGHACLPAALPCALDGDVRPKRAKVCVCVFVLVLV